MKASLKNKDLSISVKCNKSIEEIAAEPENINVEIELNGKLGTIKNCIDKADTSCEPVTIKDISSILEELLKLNFD